MTTLQDETNGWLQQNSRSILFLAVLLLGGGAVMWYLPRATQASMQASWQKYSDFQQALLSVDTPDDLNAALNATQDDVRAYKWSTLAAPSWAARTGQEDEYFAIIQNHLNSITGDDGVKILEEGTSVNIVEATKARVEGYRKLDALMPDPIEPTGSKIKVTLTNEAGTNFELVYQLYEEQAPVASAWLLGLIDEGSFAEARPIPSPQNGFQVADLPADDEAGKLYVEKPWGCFHVSGTLCTVLENGGDPGEQSRERLQFLGRDLYGQDGVTTVIGKIVEGENNLAVLGELERAEDDPQAFASGLTMTVERVTE